MNNYLVHISIEKINNKQEGEYKEEERIIVNEYELKIIKDVIENMSDKK